VTPEGGTAYVLDKVTDDVTIFDVNTGEVFDHVPVGGHPLGMLVEAGGRSLMAVSRYQLTRIRVETRKQEASLSMGEEAVVAAFGDEHGKRTVLLTEKGVLSVASDGGVAPKRVNSVPGGRILLAVP